MTVSRREFVRDISGAALGGFAARLPGRHQWTLPAAERMPEPNEPMLRELALTAMQAARDAGATFADIRLTMGRYLSVFASADRLYGGHKPTLSPPVVGFPIRYGVRAIVDGAWGFAAESALGADAIVRTARSAVAVARANKRRRPRTLELAPIPAPVQGEWNTPIERDPLSVPLHEMTELALAGAEAAYRTPEAGTIEVLFDWRRPISVFATTEGTLVLQRFALAGLKGLVIAVVNQSRGFGTVQGLRGGGYGYEALPAESFVPGMADAAIRAAAEARMPRRPRALVESGSYDMVFAPDAVAGLLETTISAALNAERALGYRTTFEGTSFAAPPAEVFGSMAIASPLVTVRADRTRLGGDATTGWDEEGVKPDEYTLVDKGIVTDYHTNRETAVELGGWYRGRGEALRSHGCMRRAGAQRPIVLTPNLTLAPGPDSSRVEDLVSDVKKGLYIMAASGGADQQVISAQYSATRVREIRNGKLGDYTGNFALQILVPRFWKSVDAIGGAASSEIISVDTDNTGAPDPLQPFPSSTFEVVPIRARRVTVLNTGRLA